MANIEKREITSELQESYLDYAMSVIVSRALPDVRDGMKPVQRRILWAMWDSGLTASAKLKKSANVVGEVMGRYHPHGDSAIYDTMVRMAQDFSLRYPLIIGQGNWGNIDGDNAAAMRYTETKLAKISAELLTDIEKDTVDWRPNYDGSRKEPSVLPSKLPTLLLNGATGIAVGMATNIPPHNLGEVINASLHLADNPKATTNDLLQFIKGPDFPTGGIIFDKKAIHEAYSTGRGGITVRGQVETTTKKAASGKENYQILISEIPYQVNKSEMIIKIAELVQARRIEGIRDIRDESDKDGLRVVIDLKNDAVSQKIINLLYKHTDLQKDFHLNMVALIDGIQPRVLSLKDIIEQHLEHRKVVVKRRAQFELRKAEERAHILEGLAVALNAIDRVINTIKKAKDKEDAHTKLMKLFNLSDVQTTAILEMRLQSLAALERLKIEDELKEKKKLITELKTLINSSAKILKVVTDELKNMKEVYGDERRTKVVAGGLKDFSDEDLIPNEEAMITFSKSGYIKCIAPGTFKSQHRGGKGLIGSDVKDEDFLTTILGAQTHDNILFFTDRGRVFQTKVYEIPVASRIAKGKPIQNFLEIPTQEEVHAIVTYPSANGKKEEKPISPGYLVMVTKNGMIKKTSLAEFSNVRRTGIIALSLKKEDALKWVHLTTGKDQIIITTRQGQGIRFKESQIRSMGRTASGVRAIRIKKDDEVTAMDVIGEEKAKDKNVRLLTVMANGYGKQTKISEFKVQSRGGSGVRAARITDKTGELMSAQLVSEEEEIIALSAKGQVIRTQLSDIRLAGRATQGVRVMSLKSGDTLVGVICL